MFFFLVLYPMIETGLVFWYKNTTNYYLIFIFTLPLMFSKRIKNEDLNQTEMHR